MTSTQQKPKRTVVPDSIRPYTYMDFVTMKPGALLMAMGVYRKETKFTPEWYVSDPRKKEELEYNKIVKIPALKRKEEELEQFFRGQYGKAKIYSVDDLPLNKNNGFSYKIVEIAYNKPVGVYLGKILRTDLGFYVLVMTLGSSEILWI